MAHITESLEVLGQIATSIDMMLNVVTFEMSRVRRVPKRMRPAAFRASVPVALQHLPPNSIFDLPVVLWRLLIAFKHVHADGEVRSPGDAGGHLPPVSNDRGN